VVVEPAGGPPQKKALTTAGQNKPQPASANCERSSQFSPIAPPLASLYFSAAWVPFIRTTRVPSILDRMARFASAGHVHTTSHDTQHAR